MDNLRDCLTAHLGQLQQQLLATKLLMQDLLPAAFRLVGKPLPGPLDLATVEQLTQALLAPAVAGPAAPATARPVRKSQAASVRLREARRNWSAEEDALVLDRTQTAVQLAAKMDRTDKAITIRRSKLTRQAAAITPSVPGAVPASAQPLTALAEGASAASSDAPVSSPAVPLRAAQRQKPDSARTALPVKASSAPKKEAGPRLEPQLKTRVRQIAKAKVEKKEKAKAKKPGVSVSADYIRTLSPNHPERVAYTTNGVRGWEKLMGKEVARA